MRLSQLVETSSRVGATRARLEKVSLLAACLAELTPEELRLGVRVLMGELPRGRIGVGHATVFGLAVEPAPEPSLSLRDLDAALERIATASGAGSKQRREAVLGELLSRATAAEQSFLRRLLVGELRQGALEGVMQDAVARAFDVPAAALRRGAMLRGDLAEVASVARGEGRAGLARFSIELMQPLSPMLAQSADSVPDVFSRLPRVALEHKLDGARVQVHRDGDEVRVFTRSLHEVSARVPEIVSAVRALPVRAAVFDGEAIALHPDGRPQPFQITMRRFGRKLDVERMRAQLPLSTFFFDVLHLDGEDLIDRDGEARSAALAQSVGQALQVPRIVTAEPAQAQAFVDAALAAGHEGVMAKDPAAAYEAGRRGAGWLKLKPVRTVDLVVLAVEEGSGRRRGLLSNIHLGARDPRGGSFAMVGKTFKGMTDAMLKWQTERFNQLAVGREGHVVHVAPEQVVEIAFDSVQASPHYASGVALRFARVKRYREDKPASEADTIDTLRALLPPMAEG